MERIGETHLLGHLFDHGPGYPQALGGVVHFQAHEILVGTLVVVALKQAAEVNAVDMALPGNLRQGFQLQKMRLDVLLAGLKGGKR